MYKLIKKQIKNRLNKLGNQNQGLRALIPDDIKRKAGNQVMGIADGAEKKINNVIKSFPQTSSETMVETETQLLAQKLLKQQIRAEVAAVIGSLFEEEDGDLDFEDLDFSDLDLD